MSDRPLDPDCLRYVDHWEPVLAGPAQRALARIDAAPGRFLDLGAGTGSLTLAAAARWPSARLVALDASGAMLDVARARAAERGLDPARCDWLVADAADVPLDTASVDAAASAFMLQIVPDRPAVLTETWRVLRPGGVLSFVTWLADDLLLPADEIYHEVMGDLGDEAEAEDFRSPRAGDYVSLEQAGDELAAAGFERIELERDELRYRWTADTYLAFKLDYDDRERIETLSGARRERLRGALTERLTALPADAFEVRGPLVAAIGHRPLS